jgi:hypothetical protein
VLTLRFPGEGALGNLEFGREVSEVRKISVLVVQQLFYTIKPKQKNEDRPLEQIKYVAFFFSLYRL